MITTKPLSTGNGVSHSNGSLNGHRETLVFDLVTPLSPQEENGLKTYECTIETQLRSFFEVGEALIKIKEEKLYRAFGTFEEYCRKRWDFTRMHACRLVHAVEVRKLLAPIGPSFVPENERQIRPLVGLAPKVAEKAWAKALELAEGKSVTGAIVAKAVRVVTKGKEKPGATKESWQKDLDPLLRKATRCCKKGEREKLMDLFYKMQLLLEVGIKRGSGGEE